MIADMSSPIALVRYGVVPEVARCDFSAIGPVARGDRVVIKTARGEQMGVVLDVLRPRTEPLPVHLANGPGEDAASFDVVRIATPEDEGRSIDLIGKADEEFPHWQARVAEWELDLQLIDLEWTLDGGQRVLYVLNDRGPDCTKLALRAAAAGLGIVSVQPVASDGLVTLPATMTTNAAHCGAGGPCGCSSNR